MLPLVAMYENQVIPKDIKTNYFALTKTHIQYLNKFIHKPRQTNTSINKHNQSIIKHNQSSSLFRTRSSSLKKYVTKHKKKYAVADQVLY